MDKINLSGMIGELKITLFNPDGTVKKETLTKNLVVSSGKTYAAARMSSNTTALMSHMELGSGTTPPTSGNSTLETPIAGSRTALDVAGGVPSASVITYSCTFPAGVGTGTISEAGIFNAATGGLMLARTKFDPFSKGSLEPLSISWSVTIT